MFIITSLICMFGVLSNFISIDGLLKYRGVKTKHSIRVLHASTWVAGLYGLY